MIRYQFTLDNSKIITKEFATESDYLEYLNDYGHLIIRMQRIYYIDEQTHYKGNILNE